ncbi:SDR family oxidoreductase [Thalassotalea psychrophila]|uniref:SDR family oxidoreductase n=1 Tax=Thalassotalea psychrophila TaxID=3065647 RepID=A0ABY9TWU0_9GAMM|nr:SDR family oxidoreductase [Colwelliaceae bacterium SQ149]
MANSNTAVKVALVTGGNGGIGFAIAKQLAEQGIRVIITGRDVEKLKHAVNELKQQELNVEGVLLDVTSEQQCQNLIDDIDVNYGCLDILINNAGIAIDQWQSGLTIAKDVVEQTMTTNVYGPLSLMQAALPIMKRQKYGRIVNISSELASFNTMEMGMTLAYRMSKAALNSMTKILALELADYPNIKINAAAPGWVKTALGGEDAPLSPEQGADTPVWLATLDADGPNGGFFRERNPYPW